MQKLLLFVGLFSCSVLYGQVRYGTLVIKKGETYQFKETDIVVADTLIMNDSSRIVLNPLKRDNFLHTKVIILGKGCRIEGRGQQGGHGRHGRVGAIFSGPCRNGASGTDGTNGLAGGNGTNLFLYVNQIRQEGSILVDLTGGHGGHGGNGGNGGNGSQGTVHCNGGEGGVGGNGGQGGDGGTGGTLTVDCQECPVKQDWFGKKIVVWNRGGLPGEGGTRGSGGYGGSGPTRRSGNPGTMGQEGERGQNGGRGAIRLAVAK